MLVGNLRLASGQSLEGCSRLAIAEAQRESYRVIDRCPSRAFVTSAASPYANLMERKIREENEHDNDSAGGRQSRGY